MDQAVVRAGPQHVHVASRGRNRIHHPAPGSLLLRRLGIGRHAARQRVGLARKVGRDRLPVFAAVGGLEHHLRSQEQNAWIGFAEEQRHGTQVAVVAAGAHLLHLSRDLVVTRHLAAVDDVRIQRIRRDVAVLLGAHRVPVAKRDLPIVAAARHARRPALLLPAVHPVGRLVIGDHVIELCRRLVVPTAPGGASVHRDGGALVGGQQDDRGVLRIDPDGVVVVAAGCALDGGEALSRVGGFIGGRVRHIHDFRIFRVYPDAGEIIAAPIHALLAVDLAEGCARVVAAIQSAGLTARLRQRVDAIAIARRDADTDPAQRVFGERRQPAADCLPGGAAIGRLVQPAVRSAERAILPRALLRLPQHRVNRLRVARIKGQIHRSGEFVLVQHLLKGLSAVGGAEHAALRVRTVRMPQGRHEQPVGIARIHQDRRNLLRIAQAEVAPGTCRRRWTCTCRRRRRDRGVAVPRRCLRRARWGRSARPPRYRSSRCPDRRRWAARSARSRPSSTRRHC